MTLPSMEKIVSLCKRRGFVFPSSEIYGGLASSWDYGPLGVELKNNVKRLWWRDIVHQRENVVGIDAASLMHPKVWEASGHLSGFTDPLVDCRECKRRFRADHLAESLHESGKLDEHGAYSSSDLEQLSKMLSGTKCPECGGELTPPRFFNLMLHTYLGPVEEEGAKTYLRPETAQGIFVNFVHVQRTSRQKVPFGIAQIGKAFRNEITPGNFIFRTREFEQMEMEFFCKPGTDESWHEYWRKERFSWYLRYGIAEEHLRLRPHEKEELAHYAKATYDIEYEFPFGWSELEGIANRTDFDLSQHATYSGEDLSVMDEETREKYVPYVIEPSTGADRAALAFLVDAWREEEVSLKNGTKETRQFLAFHKELAPVKVAVLPLLSNHERLCGKAEEIFGLLKTRLVCQYDRTGSIGRRYRRQDEIGTPYCVTVDHNSLETHEVTVRERDSMNQQRVPIAELPAFFEKAFSEPTNHV